MRTSLGQKSKDQAGNIGEKKIFLKWNFIKPEINMQEKKKFYKPHSS